MEHAKHTKQDQLGWNVAAEFPAGQADTYRDEQVRIKVPVDLFAPAAPQASRAELDHADQTQPTDGIVKTSADHEGRKDGRPHVAAIYEWIVDNTFRNPKRADAVSAIFGSCQVKDLGGKCADLNALYVGGACCGPSARVCRFDLPNRTWDRA
jgi:hypothetical protein